MTSTSTPKPIPLVSALIDKSRLAWVRLRAQLHPRELLDEPFISTMRGMVLLFLSSLPFLPLKRRLAWLAAASRRFETEGMLEATQGQLQPWLDQDKAEVWRRQQIGWNRYLYGFGIKDQRALTTSLLLKEPGANGEKGVLYCSFEFNWMKLIAHHDARRVLQDYLLVGASSWSPSDPAVLANLCGLSDDPLFIGISHESDIAQYQLFAPDIQPLPLLACDWVDPNDFKPLPHEQRTIDILMVSHFASWKRHWLLFEALRDMSPDLKVTLIGRYPPGRNEKLLLEEIRAFGVKQDITILTHLEIGEVNRYQCNAKISLALSKREGSCVSVTESMFANTPVAMMDDAHIGARAHINTSTGRLVPRNNMARVLSDMIELSGTYNPREWAMQNIAARTSSQKLNNILKHYSEKNGKPWTRDIAPLCWRYVPRYLDSADKLRLRPGLEYLRTHHGITLQEFVSEKHASTSKVVSIKSKVEMPAAAGQATGRRSP
ncbi:MAG: glycosyltransferase [Pseudomonadota bacterium]